VLEGGFVRRHTVRGVVIYTVGPYHSRSYSGKWTKLLKRVKHAPYDAEPIKPMADIMADFIAEQTPLLGEADVLVPIPPSPAKYAERGFAPNDIVADRVGARLAIPVWKVLVRRDGIDTKEASDAQLAAQFEARAPVGKRLSGLTVLLIEDIWTAGRTIPICARKLTQFQPAGVCAVALARTEG
jgi:predicted amidophosphoribosyltransferase